MPEIRDITRLLNEVEAGRDGAMDDLMVRVYDDLERMARAQLNKQFGARAGRITLEPAALVNESYLRLIHQRKAYDNRGHFFSIATRIMLRVLIDYAREKNTLKRKGEHTHITLSFDDQKFVDDRADPADQMPVEDLARALEKLESLDDRKADIVKMRVVWGLELPQIADSLEVSLSTVERDWRFAKVWIAEEAGIETSEA
ncbi:MAG: ECF-type sigma factor [Planctomycetota bacterium]|nr:ECF-type sigma factor [Planctomycetota bacterium]